MKISFNHYKGQNLSKSIYQDASKFYRFYFSVYKILSYLLALRKMFEAT